MLTFSLLGFKLAPFKARTHPHFEYHRQQPPLAHGLSFHGERCARLISKSEGCGPARRDPGAPGKLRPGHHAGAGRLLGQARRAHRRVPHLPGHPEGSPCSPRHAGYMLAWAVMTYICGQFRMRANGLACSRRHSTARRRCRVEYGSKLTSACTSFVCVMRVDGDRQHL